MRREYRASKSKKEQKKKKKKEKKKQKTRKEEKKKKETKREAKTGKKRNKTEQALGSLFSSFGFQGNLIPVVGFGYPDLSCGDLLLHLILSCWLFPCTLSCFYRMYTRQGTKNMVAHDSFYYIRLLFSCALPLSHCSQLTLLSKLLSCLDSHSLADQTVFLASSCITFVQIIKMLYSNSGHLYALHALVLPLISLTQHY